jgi:hypothetical protein
MHTGAGRTEKIKFNPESPAEIQMHGRYLYLKYAHATAAERTWALRERRQQHPQEVIM